MPVKFSPHHIEPTHSQAPTVAAHAQPSPEVIPTEDTSVIPAQITFAGEASFEGDVRIAGTISGTVSAANGRSIVVEKGASVNGTLKSTNIHVEGSTEGDIFASGGLASFSASAVSKGHITYSRLRIAEGAEVEASMKKLVV